jgi:hypothetical protein
MRVVEADSSIGRGRRVEDCQRRRRATQELEDAGVVPGDDHVVSMAWSQPGGRHVVDLDPGVVGPQQPTGRRWVLDDLSRSHRPLG